MDSEESEPGRQERKGKEGSVGYFIKIYGSGVWRKKDRRKKSTG